MGTGKKVLPIVHIADRSRRANTFRKRFSGLMKKSLELHILTGALVRLTVVFQGKHYVFENGQPGSPDAAAYAAKKATSRAAAADRRQQPEEIEDVPQQEEIEVGIEVVSDGDWGREEGGGGPPPPPPPPPLLTDAAVLEVIDGMLQPEDGDKWDDVEILTEEEVASL